MKKRNALGISLGLSLWLMSAGAVSAAVYHVKPTGSDAASGLNWSEALASVTNALSRASAPDEIWIAAGTYKPTDDTTRTKSFILKPGVSLYGGFAGTETLREQRDWEANPTILSGDIGVEGDPTDNVYQVIIAADGARLDGLIIQDGHADGPANETRTGGALYSVGKSITLANCVFTNNIARGGTYNVFGGAGGAAVFWYQSVYSPAGIEIYDCVFADNVVSNLTGHQSYGAALSVITLADATCIISNTVFENNRSYGGAAGAGAFALRHASIGAATWSGGRVLLQDCDFIGNRSANYSPGAGFIQNIPIPVEMTNCTFVGNWAGGNHSTPGGGALYVTIPGTGYGVQADNCHFEGNAIPAGYGGAVHIASAIGTNSTWRNCTFLRNDARGNGGGGAISGAFNGLMEDCTFEANFNWNAGGAIFINAAGATASAIFTNCTFLSNTNQGNSNGGGAVCVTPGNMRAEFYNCEFTGNASGVNGNGGAIYFGAGTGIVERCTFEANRILSGNRYGGAIAINSGELDIRHSTFTTNTAVYGGAVSIIASRATIEDCVFTNNIGQYRGAVIASTPVEIRRSVFVNNRCKDNTSGLSYGGGLYLNHPGKTSLIANSVFRDNSGWDGGAIVNLGGGSVIISNVTARGNVSRRGASWGGAIYHVDTGTNTCQVVNSILWDNSTEIVPSTGVTVSYSCVKGGFAGEGNLDIDPMFVDTTYLHLTSTTRHYVNGFFTGGSWATGIGGDSASPCIDTGNPLHAIRDERDPHGDRINMGAYGGTLVASASFRAGGTLFIFR